MGKMIVYYRGSNLAFDRQFSAELDAEAAAIMRQSEKGNVYLTQKRIVGTSEYEYRATWSRDAYERLSGRAA